ncbi:MAG: nuclear transport factor 2 family protein [Deltaproteobacteria bacterium]|nr:nuclear transport factor 2 family protein [Deltaproteobacteria bacterium]
MLDEHGGDIRRIQDTCVGVMHDIDLRYWDGLADLFAPDVTTDYTSLFGGEAVTQSAVELIAGWRAALSNLDSTQHLLGPIAVQVNNDAAVAHTHVRAWHKKAGLAGGESWMVAGHYTFRLIRADEHHWKISAVKLTVLDQEGNVEMLAQASGTAEA